VTSTALESDVPFTSQGSGSAASDQAQRPGSASPNGGFVSTAPKDLRSTGLDPAVVSLLALKTAYTVLQFTTEWTRRLHLPQPVGGEVLEQLRSDSLLDILGSSGPFGFRYSILGRGRERATRLLQISSYVGPATVSLDDYRAIIEWQPARTPEIKSSDVA
jgi:hypothetical protein